MEKTVLINTKKVCKKKLRTLVQNIARISNLSLWMLKCQSQMDGKQQNKLEIQRFNKNLKMGLE